MRKIAQQFLILVFILVVNQVYGQKIHTCELNKNLQNIDSLLRNNPQHGIAEIRLLNNKKVFAQGSCENFLLKQHELYYYLNSSRFDSASLLLNEIKTILQNSNLKHSGYINYKAALLNANFLSRTGNFDEALKILDEVINSKKIINDDLNLFLGYLNKAIIFQNKQLPDTTLKLVEFIRQTFEKSSEAQQQFYKLYIIKSFVYRDMDDFKKSCAIIEPHVKEVKSKNKLLYANICLLLSQNYFELNDFKLSKFYTDEGIKTLEIVKSNTQKPIFYIRQSFLDTVNGNYKSAYINLMNAYNTNSIVFNDKTNVLVQNNMIRYKTEIKEIENKNLKTERVYFTAIILISVVILGLLTILLLKLKRTKDKLEDANNFQNKLISIISHDFRSPLYALHDLTNQVAYTIKKQQYDKLDHLANGVSESSVRMTNLLNNLLNWVYLNKTLRVEQVNIHKLVNDTKALYENIILNKHLSFYNNIDASLALTIKKNVLEIIIRNWLDNILKYSNASQVIFSAIVENNVCKIIIENNSVMPPEHLKQINAQLNKHTEIKNETSIGLGLNLIANFSKEESWKVELESEHEQTRFTIIIHS